MKYLALRVALNTFHLTTVLQNPLQLSINAFNVRLCALVKLYTPHYGPLTGNHPTYLLATPLILETKSPEVHTQSQLIYSATLIYGDIYVLLETVNNFVNFSSSISQP